MESEILDENLTGEAGHRHQAETLEPLAQGSEIDVLALALDIDAQHENLTDGQPFVENVAHDADNRQQQLAGCRVGVLIVEDVLQLVVQDGVREMVGTQELILLIAQLMGLRTVFLCGLLPFLPLLVGHVEKEL